jgi:hypothetical protein
MACVYLHRDYINKFLIKEMAANDYLANIAKDDIKLLHPDVFSYDNCVIAEKVAKRFYCSAAFDLGDSPKFFSGQFSDEAALFLARIYAARTFVGRRGIYGAAPAVHDAFVNAWLRARAHGASSDINDALACPWSCIQSAIRKCEDVFICEAVRWCSENAFTSDYKADADAILENATYALKYAEPALCAGLH